MAVRTFFTDSPVFSASMSSRTIHLTTLNEICLFAGV